MIRVDKAKLGASILSRHIIKTGALFFTRQYVNPDLMRKKFAIFLAVLCLILGYLSYSWGLWTYIFSISGTVPPSPNARRSDDTFFKADGATGRVLLVHGLNFDASKLHPLAELFVAEKQSVLVPRLAGHRGAIEETLSVPTEIWFSQVREWKAGLESPLTCAGYSLGGLLVTERYLKGELECSGFVLFAPAFALRTPGVLADFLIRMTPSSFTVPSGIPQAYMHFDHPGLGPTYALAQVLQSFDRLLKEKKGQAMPPGVVFIDPRDQVIAPEQVRERIRDHFPEWKIVEIEAVDLPENHAFHLIIDEPHVGAEQWLKIRNEIGSALKR